MKRRRRLNPSEEQERRAAAVMHDSDLDYDAAIDLANRILAGEEVAEALSGTGLVVDMSPQPAQIAEIETSRGVVEVPVRESAPAPGSRRPSSAPPEDDLPSFDDAVQAIDRANATARTADPNKLREGVHQLLKRLPKSTLKQVAQHFDVVFQPIAGYSPVDQLIAATFGSKLVSRAFGAEERRLRKAYSRSYSR